MLVRFAPAVALVAILFGAAPACSYKPEGLPAASVRAGDGGGSRAKGIGTGVFGEPIVLAGWDLVLVPYSIVRRDSGMKFSDSFLGSMSFSSFSGGGSYSLSESGSYRSTSRAHWNNLLVYEKQSGDARLLLDERVVIVQAFFPNARPNPNQPKPPPPLPPHVLLACAWSDTNGDRVINSEDATVLYHMSLVDRSLTPLTPEGGRFDDLTLDEDGRTLYARSVIDSDGDHRFTEADDAVIARVDLADPAMGTPIVPDELRQRAFSLIASDGQ